MPVLLFWNCLCSAKDPCAAVWNLPPVPQRAHQRAKRTIEPQSYELPKLDNGKVEVNVKFGNETSSSITLIYDDKGLLIYLANFSILHMYLVSGKETTCYNKATDSDEFTIETEFPPLKAIPAKENPGFVSIYSGWKENEWVVNEIKG